MVAPETSRGRSLVGRLTGGQDSKPRSPVELYVQMARDWMEVYGHKTETETMNDFGSKMTEAWWWCFESCGEDPMMGVDAREGGRRNGCEPPLDLLRQVPHWTYRANFRGSVSNPVLSLAPRSSTDIFRFLFRFTSPERCRKREYLCRCGCVGFCL